MDAEYSVTMGPTSLNRTRVTLASRSPRRRMLLDERGVSHEAEHPGFEDSVLERGQVSPEQWVTSLAYLKAWAKASETGAGGVVIGADTACLMDGKLIGTPRDAQEAQAMIRGFIGREHDVLTGVAIIDLRGGACVAGAAIDKRTTGPLEPVAAPSRHMFVDKARVRLGHLSEDQIRAYIASGAWQGKAGGYNFREAVEAGWPLSHEGDQTTIMGLPMDALMRRLTDMGIINDAPLVAGPIRMHELRGVA